MELYFGNNIRRLRKAADITQDSFAQALGVTSQSVSKWECGVSRYHTSADDRKLFRRFHR